MLEKRAGLRLYNQDVYINVAGGLSLSEPAADLAVCMAAVSSFRDLVLPAEYAIMGEVGLAGEIRPVNRIEQRIAEAEKLGFKRILIPEGQKIDTKRFKIEVVPVKRVTDAFRLLIKS